MSAVLLTADALRTLAQRPDVLAEFPFLIAFARPASSGCCGGGPAGPDPAKALIQIAGLPPGRKAVIKRLIGADTIKIRVVRAGRQRDLVF